MLTCFQTYDLTTNIVYIVILKIPWSDVPQTHQTYQQLFGLLVHVFVAMATWRVVSHGIVLPWRGGDLLAIRSPAFVLMNVCPSIRVSMLAICIYAFFSVWANQFRSCVSSYVYYLGFCDWAPTGYITGCEARSCISCWGAIAQEGVDERASCLDPAGHPQFEQRVLHDQTPVLSDVERQEGGIWWVRWHWWVNRD